MEKELFNPDFLIIPKEVMHLPPADRFIMGAVYFMSRLSLGRCIASNVELGRICGIKAHSVTNSLDRLESEGFVKRLYKDEEKRNRTEIVCLIGFGKFESSGILKTSALISTRKSSTKEHISNTISNNIIAESKETIKNETTPFIASERIQAFIDSPQTWLKIIGLFAKYRHLEDKLKTQGQFDLLIPKYRRVATELSEFDGSQLREAFRRCDEMTDKQGGKIDWTLFTVKSILLK
jgi:DNA-binding Lrp family transcriptional regulator